jgi:hypothetical protein
LYINIIAKFATNKLKYIMGGFRIGAGRKKLLPMPNEPNFNEIWKMIDNSLIKGAKGTGIADRLGICPKTLYRYGELCGKWGRNNESGITDFSAYKRLKHEVGNDLLRMRQYDLAMGIYDETTKQFIVPPNVSMLIWLGKVRLGQSDRINSIAHSKPSLSNCTELKIQVINKFRSN